MATFTPYYKQELLSLRIPDKTVSPALSAFDFFYSASNREFYIKTLNDSTVTKVKIDFLGLSNCILYNNKLQTPQ